jgi:hypothetical protein
MEAMITADGSFLDRLCDRAAQPVNPQQLRCGGAWCAERWDVDCIAVLSQCRTPTYSSAIISLSVYQRASAI